MANMKIPVAGLSLGFFFGPIGLLYSNVKIALVSFGVMAVIGIGLGLLALISGGVGMLLAPFVLLPAQLINAFLGYHYCKKYNDAIFSRLDSGAVIPASLKKNAA